MIIRKHFFLLCLICSVSVSVPVVSYGQSSDNSKQADIDFLTYGNHWKELDVEINSWWIFNDDEGFIWFNSAEGLCRFDGTQFYYFKHDPANPSSIPNGLITAMVFKNKDQAWIGFRRLGFYLYDLKTEKVLKSYMYSPSDKNGISSNGVSSLLFDNQSKLWVVTSDNVLQSFDEDSEHFVKYEMQKPNAFKDEYADTSPGRIIQDVNDQNVLWIASRFGLYKFNVHKGSFQHYEIDKYVRPYLYQFPTPIYQTDDGLIWYGHFRNEGIKVFDPKKEKWIASMPVPESTSTFTFDIKPYGESLLIASLRPDHFVILDKFNPGTYSIVESNHEVAKFSCLAVDKNLSLYSTSPTGKLTKLNRFRSKFEVTKLTDNLGLPFYTWCVLFHEGRSEYYISPVNGSTFSIFSEKFELIQTISLTDDKFDPSIRINDLGFHEESGLVIIASNNGLFTYDPSNDIVSRKLENTALESVAIEKIKFNQDEIWLLENKALISFNYKSETVTRIKLPDFDLTTDLVKDIAFLEEDQIFISTNKGLLLYDLEQQEFQEYTTLDGLFDLSKIVNCNSLIKDGDVYWLGTQHNGIYKLKQVDPLQFEVKNYYYSNSTLANSYRSITLNNNQIWGATSSGFTVFDIEKEDFINFLKTDGVIRGYRKMIFYAGSDNTLISPFHDGFYQFDPASINADKVSPFLVKVKINNEDVDLNSFELRKDEYSFKNDQKDIFFELGALNFGVENKTFFRYRLLGVSDQWNFLDDNNSVNFINLPVGKYTLEYDARSFHSYWNEKPSRFDFEIKSHALLTPFFKLLWLLLTGLGLYLLFRKYRNDRDKKEKFLELQKLRAESELKALKAQMNPHFLFNTLNSINWYIIKEKSVEASKYLTKFAKLMRLILDNSKAEKITLAKELETLRLYTELEEVRFEGEFDYDFQIEQGINPEQFLMPPLIFQPFIENAIWHGLVHKAEKGSITLKIFEESNHLRCTIEDNGIGRQAAMKIKAKASNYRESSGIEITKQRIKGINQSNRSPFEIVDLENDGGEALGTRIEILLPIEKLSKNSISQLK